MKTIKQALPQDRLSVDTYRSDIARQAIETGVTMVNDILAKRADDAESRNALVADRLPATLTATAITIRHGVAFIHTHDVIYTKKILMY